MRNVALAAEKKRNSSKTYCWAATCNLRYLGGAGGTRIFKAAELLEAARGGPCCVTLSGLGGGESVAEIWFKYGHECGE